MRRWHKLHPGYAAQRNRNYRLKYHEKSLESTRKGNEKWRTEKHDDYLNSKAKHRQNTRLKIIEFYGGKCVNCGITDFRVLQVDHINGDGFKSKKKKRVGAINRYYNNTEGVYGNWALIKKDPDNARQTRQLMCANCNWIKRWENKEWGTGLSKEWE